MLAVYADASLMMHQNRNFVAERELILLRVRASDPA
jgi:hypothetical protein